MFASQEQTSVPAEFCKTINCEYLISGLFISETGSTGSRVIFRMIDGDESQSQSFLGI